MKKRSHRNARVLFRAATVTTILMAIVTIGQITSGEQRFGLDKSNHTATHFAPVLNLNPDTLDFGDQVVRRTSAAKRTIAKNIGDVALYVESVDLRGDNPGAFAVLKDTCTGMTIEPDRACIVDVTFTPSVTGDRNARLKFISNAIGGPQPLILKGKGINAIDVEPF